MAQKAGSRFADFCYSRVNRDSNRYSLFPGVLLESGSVFRKRSDLDSFCTSRYKVSPKLNSLSIFIDQIYVMFHDIHYLQPLCPLSPSIHPVKLGCPEIVKGETPHST